jgi:hypothetical protein
VSEANEQTEKDAVDRRHGTAQIILATFFLVCGAAILVWSIQVVLWVAGSGQLSNMWLILLWPGALGLLGLLFSVFGIFGLAGFKRAGSRNTP